MAEAGTSGDQQQQQLNADQARRDKLKVAGAAYFEKLLAAEAAARQEAPPVPVSKPAPGALPLTALDAEFQQLESVIEGSRVYVLATLLTIGQASGLVWVKASLDALLCPGFMAFLHLAPTAATLWLLAGQGAVEVRQLTAAALQAAAPSTLLATARTLLLFYAAPRCTLWLLLCWAVTVPLVVSSALAGGLARAQPAQLAGLGVAALATAGALLTAPWPGVTGLAALLLWAATEMAAAGWGQLQRQPELLTGVVGEERAAALRAVAEDEAALTPATLALLQAALPLAPLLLWGFLTGEAGELVDHELSVPAVTKILLSVVAWALVAVCSLLTAGGIPREARAALVAAAPLGTILIEAAVHGVAAGQAAGLAAAVVVAAAGLGLQLAAVPA